MSRKVIFSVASSLDGRLAARDGGIDWIQHSDEGMESLGDFWQSVDTILVGRKTYDFGRAKLGKSAPFAPGMKCYVFSRTLKPGDDPHVEVVSTDADKFIRKLKKQPGKNIFLMGGGELAQSFFDAGLIDEVSLNIQPILLGGGPPLFPPLAREIKLNLTNSKSLKNGCVLATYKVKR
ncbi:MAG TPA: dihydrofolate reductase family protein [Lacipirellulaceae bacterium]|jgi:dihydrofolate reductase